jgi:sulfatase maturation enzyme AslB (radical SAM superfamily)
MTLETLERLVSGYLAYSFPNSTFAFQGGEPTLCGLPFFEKLVAGGVPGSSRARRAKRIQRDADERHAH